MRGLVGRAQNGRGPALRWGMALALSAAVALAAAPARAEDGGLFGFLSAALGGGSAAPAPSAPPPTASEGEQVRPLTVRRAPKKAVHAGAGRARLARVPTKTGPVSIYEDPTLRSGDAVMTKDGMKVFAGGRFSPEHPYEDANFVAVSAAKTVAPNLKKTVIELNKLPHG
ncbi:hypothetical protein D3273_10250 [Lichenibacterium minor]|uniref:Uncharacterized protein n=1 Tax=Lichenibacterium minor TaxID=2316528 RepID=A0A4Q2UAG2_9HYPH|nr:hypothetical protein [Lichenibacterium minor]RYC32097.1 hypothetical protein D3273_10250 [Lichenibacterium minor]